MKASSILLFFVGSHNRRTLLNICSESRPGYLRYYGRFITGTAHSSRELSFVSGQYCDSWQRVTHPDDYFFRDLGPLSALLDYVDCKTMMVIAMNDDAAVFQSQLLRLREGDRTAIREFVTTYEPYIRRTLRHRIARSLVRRAADSVDVCQSVLGSFLLRLSAGDYELHEEADLRKLLAGIAENKFLALVRRESAAKRDHRKTVSLDQVQEVQEPLGRNPIVGVEHQDLIEELTKRLSPEENDLYQRKRQGHSWETIAEQLNCPAITLRKRLSRGVQRVAMQLGLETDE